MRANWRRLGLRAEIFVQHYFPCPDEWEKRTKKHFWGCAPISWIQTLPCTFCRKLVKLSRAKRTWDAFFFSFARMLSCYFKFYEYIFFFSFSESKLKQIICCHCPVKTMHLQDSKWGETYVVCSTSDSKRRANRVIIVNSRRTSHYTISTFQKANTKEKEKEHNGLIKTRGRQTFKQ